MDQKGAREAGTIANPNVVDSIVENGFRTDLPSPQQAFHNNKFGSGVYLADSPVTALAERPRGTVLYVQADLGKTLNVTNRGNVDYDMGQAIARGARKQGYNLVLFNSAQSVGGINTLVFNPSKVIVGGIVK